MFSIHHCRWIVVAALALTSANGSRADEKDAKDDQAIRAVVGNFFSALEKRDPDALAACLADKFSSTECLTKAKFVEFMKNIFAKTDSLKYTVHIQSVQRSPEPARVRVDYVEKLKTKSGRDGEEEARWALYLERDGGAWKLTEARSAYLDVIIRANKAKNEEGRIAAFRAEGDDFITDEFLAKLYDEQAGIIDRGDFDLAAKFQEFAELAVKAIEDKEARELQEGVAFLGRAKMAERQSNYEEAIAASRKSLAAFRKRARTFEVSVMSNLGVLLYQQGNFKESIKVLEEARTMLGELNQFAKNLNQAKLLGNLGAAYTELGENDKALRFLEESIESARKVGDKEAELNAHLNQANIYVTRGSYTKAIRIYEEVRQAYAKAGMRAREGQVLNNIGNALAEQKRFADAIRKFEAARQACTAAKDRRGLAQSLMNLGITHYRLGAEADAERYTEQALQRYRDIGDKAGTCRALMTVGLLRQEAGRHDQALKYLRESLEMAKASGRKDDLAQAYMFLGVSLEERGEPEEAIKNYDEASKLYDSTHDPVRAAHAAD